MSMEQNDAVSDELKIEESFSKEDFARILRELADALESSNPFAIYLKGRVVSVLPTSEMKIEYESKKAQDEVELKLRWKQTDR